MAHTGASFIPSWFRFHHNYGLFEGSLGVDVFFVLSGFLITALLLRDQTDRGHVNLGSFYRNRALRLLPALVVMLAGVLAFRWLAGESMRGQLESAAFGLFYLANWQSTWNHHEVVNFGHLWSLSVEEQFYLVWPSVLIVCFGLRRNVRVVTAGLVAVIVAIAIRRGLLWGSGYNWVLLYQHADMRADSLLIGALLACLWVRRLTPQRGLSAAGWIASGVLVACVAFTRSEALGYFRPSNGFLYQGGFVLVAVACAVMILASVDGRWAGTRVLELRPLRALGVISYGLYLWHLPVFVEVAAHTKTWAVLPRVALAWAIAFALTIASWKVVEQPSLRLKNRPGRRNDEHPGTPAVILPRRDTVLGADWARTREPAGETFDPHS
jgi:peptidoglycan/LPS O-acetylase OafA/YrhL